MARAMARRTPVAPKRRAMARRTPVSRTPVTSKRPLVRQIARPLAAGRKRPAAAAAAAAPAASELDAKRRRMGKVLFSRQPLECSLCCIEVPAGDAVRLGCSHGWYCRGCVERYAQARLAEGAVDVSCPDCREPIPDHDLKSILNQDVINRFHDRSISRAVASSSNLHTCPTAGCTMCFEIDDGDYWLRQCPGCKLESCLRCGAQPYHKGLSCQAHAAKIGRRKQRDAASDASFTRWMRRTGTKQCPQCKQGVSKQDLAGQGTQHKECHKMMCRGCMTKFCFKCLAILTDTYNCGCSIERHGFLNPITGRRNEHLKKAARHGA